MPEDPTGGYIDSPFVSEFYDYDPDYRARPDVAFYLGQAREATGSVLEVGCGTGRVLLPIAEAGHEITGLDLSPFMLGRLRTKLAQEPAEVQRRVTLVEGDMRDFDLGRTFSLITIPFRPFQHLITVADQLRCLGSIRKHLAPGGRFILDIFNPSLPHLIQESYTLEQSEGPALTLPDGRVVRPYSCVSARDLANQVISAELIYYVAYPDGHEERLVHRFPMRYLFRYEAEHLLVRAGFQVEALYADYDYAPFGSKYPGELIFVTRAA